jgi:HEPN domain-containing protein
MTDTNRKKHVEIWLGRVNYDLETAQAMYKTGRYIYVVFMAQQAIEKSLKAIIEAEGKVMPFEHNLRRLLNLTETNKDFPDSWWTNIDFLSQYYLNARYKEDITVLQQKITAKVAKDFLSFAEEVSEWCIARIRSI